MNRFRTSALEQVFGTARGTRSPHPPVRLAATMLRHLARRPAAMRSLPAMRALCTPKDAPPPAEPAETVNFFFIEDGEEIPATAAIGTSLLEAAHENDVDLEGAAPRTPCRIDRASHRRAVCAAGACDHSLACSTCHVVLEQEVFSELDAVDDEEMDMLDLAFGLEDTSRLGCQVKVSKLLEGTKVTLPTERI